MFCKFIHLIGLKQIRFVKKSTEGHQCHSCAFFYLILNKSTFNSRATFTTISKFGTL